MPLEHQASGRVRLNGCAGITLVKNYPALYAVGQRVWIRQKATMGKFESVVVKRVRINTTKAPSYGGVEIVVVYADTFNRVWIESELASQAEAEALVESHRSDFRSRLRSLYDAGACFPIKPEGCG
jgi:hypothetical protein